MSFIKNPFRKSDKTKLHQKAVNPATNRATNQSTARQGAQGAKPSAGKSSLPRNYLDNNVF